MAYTGKYVAYVKWTNGEKQEWRSLRKAQAQWRYNWINRNADCRNCLGEREFTEFGWQREWQD